jgi:hypothetical protein
MKIKTLFVVLGLLLSLFVGSTITAQAAPPKHHSAAWYRTHRRHHSAAWYRRHRHHTVVHHKH